ncbi:MAG: twitching motility protein PilT [Candidatus Marinimicrobia bacterium]|nr:twitching motility protein PilT [Candidatus Neomarinimicrobiota bacterium]|tara:strand:- start:1493 stop:2551 length:1059 start_codon:yes stop_codon:yes gene_type:complete
MSTSIKQMLAYALEADASDLHLSVGSIPMLRIHGQMQKLQLPVIDKTTMLKIRDEVLSANQKKIFEEKLEIDFSTSLEDKGRFRVNFFNQINGIAAVFRAIPTDIKNSEELGIPPIMNSLAMKEKGLVLLTGPTGSGKSTTLAAMIDHVNENKSCHIITIEDPVEYYHNSKKSMINQREIGQSTHSFSNALRSALREDPDVILVGEMRDLETIQLALTAAETGHLVLSTLHTSSAVKTIDRIIDVFPSGQKGQIRSMLSESLLAVIAQKLLPNKLKNGRIPASEIMIANHAIRNLIREDKIYQIPSLIQAGGQEGMQSLDQDLQRLLHQGLIERTEAAKIAENSEVFEKGVF